MMEKPTETLYALSLQAYNAKKNSVEHSAWAAAATSLEEAETKGMERAFELWPLEKGWTRHDASPLEVTVHVSNKQHGPDDDLPERVM